MPLHALAGVLLTAVALAPFGFAGDVPWGPMALFAVWAGSVTVQLFGERFLQGEGRFGACVALRAVTGTGTGGAVLVLTATRGLSVMSVSVAYCLTGIAGGLAGWWVLRAGGKGRTGDIDADVDRCEYWSYARRNMAAVFSESLNNRIDHLALTVVGGNAAVGVYAVATSYSWVVRPLVGEAVALVAFTTMSRSRAGLDAIPGERLNVARHVRSVSWPALAGCLVLFIAAPVAIPLVYGGSFEPAVWPARLLLVGMLFASLNEVLGSAARSAGRPEIVSRSEALGALATVIGVVILAGHGLRWVAAVGAGGYACSTASYALWLWTNRSRGTAHRPGAAT